MKYTDRFIHRPLSYSQLSSFEYDPAEWYNRYIKGIKDKPTPAMEFGTVVGDSIGTAGSLVPTLVPPGVKEYELSARIDDILIVGYADHYCPETKTLHENKTSDNPTRWDQKKVDGHDQLTMYALMLFLRDKTEPKDVTMYLNFIPVVRGGDMNYAMPDPPTFHQFKTTRSRLDIINYAIYIKDMVKKMEAYVNAYVE